MIQTISSSQRHSFSLRCCLAITLFLTIIAFLQPIQAQLKYGISAITTVTPPYPITLDGFVAEGGTKMALQILPTDVTIAQYPVLLKLVISGNGITIESRTLTIHEPVYLNGNEITRLDGNDLQAFFNPDNLNFNGYSKTQYQRNGRLPEGVYTVGFELYDVLRKIQVASVKSTLVFLFLNEVPSLNLPLSGDLISAAGTQVVNFRWSTRHSPLAATFFTPQYLFEMWDIQPEGMNPYEVVRGTRPVYAATVSSTYLSYGIAEPPLLPGHTYVWRVRETDPDGKTLFKNDGYSEVYTFKYGINCPAPELKADKAGTSNLSVLWQASPDQNKFELRYRDKKKKNPEWYTQSVNTLSSKVENLKSNTVYEIEVCAICGDQRSEYSNRVEMNTRQNTSFKCGQIDSSKLPQNQNPLRKLSPGDVFKAFGFDVEVKEASGSGGTFTGKGYVLVPLLNFIKIEAKFDNARINEDYQLIGGEVKTVYNLKNSLTYIPGQGIAGLSDLTDLAKLIAGDKEKNQFDDLADKKIEVDSVKDIKIEGNKIIVTDANGKTEEVPLSAGKVVSIKTDEGKEYVVDTNSGTIYSSGNSGQKAASGTPSGPVTTAALAGKGSPKYNVSFIPHKLQECGFDYPTDKSPKDNYEQVSLTENPILVPWKSLEAGHIERTVAEIAGGPADSVRYYRQSNNVVMTAPGEKATQKQIMLNGNGKNDEDKLFAWYAAYNQADSGKTYARVLAGQLNLISYEKKSIKVVLVPVNNASCPDAGYVKTELNKIYKSAVVEWDVAQGNNIKVSFPGAVFDNTDPNDRMDYTDDMKAVISALKEDAQYNRETYYLFFLDNAKDQTTKGYMPLKQQFGFIFKYKQYPDEYLRTIAHELGHGPFRLWHTFSNSNKYIQPQGATDNLMDYANASALKLNKYQWDWMHDPEWRIYWFTEEDEGASLGYSFKLPSKPINEFGEKQVYNIEQLIPGEFGANSINYIKTIPKGIPFSSKLTEIQIYKFALCRALFRGSFLINNDEYLDEKLLEAEFQTRYFFTHNIPAYAPNSEGAIKGRNEAYNNIINALLYDDNSKGSEQDAINQIKKSCTFLYNVSLSEILVFFIPTQSVSISIKGAFSFFKNLGGRTFRSSKWITEGGEILGVTEAVTTESQGIKILQVVNKNGEVFFKTIESTYLNKYPNIRQLITSVGSKLQGKYSSKTFAFDCIVRLDNETLNTFERFPWKLEEYFNNLAGNKSEEIVATELKTIVINWKTIPRSFYNWNNLPKGSKARIYPKDDAETIRSLTRENESAEILAKNGFDIEQLPKNKTLGVKDPDFKIEGRIFDNYAPITNNSRNIWSIIKGKVDAGQTQRVILNLSDSQVNLIELQNQFSNNVIEGLEEVIIIQNNAIFHLIP